MNEEARPATAVQCRCPLADGSSLTLTATRRPRAGRAEVKCTVAEDARLAERMQQSAEALQRQAGQAGQTGRTGQAGDKDTLRREAAAQQAIARDLDKLADAFGSAAPRDRESRAMADQGNAVIPEREQGVDQPADPGPIGRRPHQVAGLGQEVVAHLDIRQMAEHDAMRV